MTRGTPKARVHDTFHALLQQMRENAKARYLSLRGEQPQPFELPPQAGTQQNVPELKTGFDRAAMNENYAECVTDPTSFGTVADVIAIKHQIMYVAAAERAYAVRHCSSVRAAAHGAARQRGLWKSAVLPNIEALPATFIGNSGTAKQ